VDTLAAILHEEPEPLAALAPQSPAPLQWAVQRCLAKDAAERYASTRDLARDLAAIREHVSAPDRSGAEGSAVRRGPGRRLRALVPLAVAVGGALAIAFVAGRFTDPVREALAKLAVRRVTFRRGNLVNARFAPDGETIVYSAAWEGRPQEVFVTSVRGAESRSPRIANGQLLAVSKTGDLAVLLKKDNLASKEGVGTLARVSMLGGLPREILENAGWMVDWGTAGQLAVARENAGQTILEYPIGKVFYKTNSVIHCPRVAPDGERIAFFDASGGEWALVVVDRKGKRQVLVRMSDGFSGWGDLAWNPSGSEVWFNAVQPESNEGLFAVTMAGKLRTVLRPLGMFVLLDISRTGRVLLEAETYRKELMYFGPGDSKERDLSWLDRSELRDLSRDGRALLISEHRGSDGGEGAYLRKSDGSDAVRIASGYAQSLSQDGKWALVLVPAAGQASFQLFRVPTGAGQAEGVPVGNLNVESAAWIPPDGKRIFLSANTLKEPERGYVLDFATGQTRPVGPTVAGGMGGFSPDGRFVTMADSANRWAIYPLDGGDPRPIPGLDPGEVVGSYVRDGGAVYVTRFGEIPLKIDRLDLGTGQRTPWKQLSPADPTGLIGISSFGISADDGAYAYNVERVVSDDLFVLEGLK